jgi:hypothetical protein
MDARVHARIQAHAFLRWAVFVRLGVFVLPAGLRISARECFFLESTFIQDKTL